MKKFIPRRYVLLYLCENYIFLAFICYVDHFINQKNIKRYYQLNLTRSRYFCYIKNGTEFTKDLAAQFVP